MDDDKLWKGLGYVAVTAILLPLVILYYAWTSQMLWNWFMPAIGLPELGLWQVYGIDMVFSWFTFRISYDIVREWTDGEQLKRVGYLVGMPLFFVAIGGIIKHWVM